MDKISTSWIFTMPDNQKAGVFEVTWSGSDKELFPYKVGGPGMSDGINGYLSSRFHCMLLT